MRRYRSRRAPSQIIGRVNDPYLKRWYVIPRNPLFNVYYHEFHRSDDDRALHDHPWWSVSIILEYGYDEYVPENPAQPHSAAHGELRRIARQPGEIVFRRAASAHRIELHPGSEGRTRTLFITGPRFRRWGFLCPHGWRHWKKFVSESGNVSSVGRGCD